MKPVWRFLQQHLGVEPARQRDLVDCICTAVAATVTELKHHIRTTPGFAEVGSRMLWEWNAGMRRLQQRRTFAMPDWVTSASAEGLPVPAPAQRYASARIGESPLMAPRRRKSPAPPPS